jgi:hypothetical protein
MQNLFGHAYWNQNSCLKKKSGDEKSRESVLSKVANFMHQKGHLKLFDTKHGFRKTLVRYHCGGWSEEENSCILILSYMVYL